MTKYINEFKSIFDQLNSIGKPVSDKRKVFDLLTNLGPAYEAFSTNMLKPPMPSYSEIIPLLHSHELRNKHNESTALNQTMAFYTATNKGRGYGGSNNSFSSKGRGFTQTTSKGSQNSQSKSKEVEKNRGSSDGQD
ncbi:UBN2_2 domain-containing protein [Cephalotus follicularis]|uniref:UBN2_2 domain-containing protein n=1 Tax=Cephalotus follicularis TaxID=3775 RepID=A0A1Q3C5I3_CEPFO|nr:UBN2_2 domain-containing protein [Cephalotus follicularis]